MAYLEKTMHNFLGMTNFTNVQKANCVLWLAEFQDISKVIKKFKEEYGDNPEIHTPPEAEIRHWYEHFQKSGSFEHDYIVEEPKHIKKIQSEEKAEHSNNSNHWDIHTTTYQKHSGILGFCGFGGVYEKHPYKMHLKKKFTAEDMAKRLNYAQTELKRIHSIDYFENKMWFAGEATFYTNGRVECHNLVYLSENPDSPESKRAPPPNTSCVTVWAAFNCRTILGPYISIGHANKATYHLFLKKFTYELRQIQRLELKLYRKPMAADGTMELELRIQAAFTEIFPEMLEAASKAYKERLKMVIENDGNLVEAHDDYENLPIQTDIEAMRWMKD